MTIQPAQTGQTDQQGTQQGTQESPPQAQQGTDQAGQSQQTPPSTHGLLDEEASRQQDGETSGAENSGQQGGNQQGAAGEAGLTADAVARIVESAIDRRINAVLREQRQGNQQGQQGQAAQGQTGQQQGQQQPAPPQTPEGPAAGDVREARAAYREFVGDEIRFLSGTEREHALTIANGLLGERLRRGEDPDAAGREVARAVATQIKALRQHYEDRTVAALRRRGLLPAEDNPPAGTAGQQPPPGGATPTDASAFVKGQTKAQQMFAHRLPKQ